MAPLLFALLIGCAKSPEQMVEDTKQQAQEAVNKKIDDEVNKVKKQISDLAGKKMEEAQNYVNDIKKTGSLSEASKKFITDTMKLKDGLAAAAASGPIEEAMKSGKENLPWIKKELEKAIQTSNGQAKIAWQQLLERVNEAMKK